MKKSDREKILKLREVFRDSRCPSGERENAGRLYERLLKKFGLTDADIEVMLDNEKKFIAFFPYSDEYEDWLIQQLCAKITEHDPMDGYYPDKKKMRNGFELTSAQAKLAQKKYKALRKSLKAELEICFKGFVQSNNLGLDGKTDIEKLTPEELAEIAKILTYASNIEETKFPITERNRLIGKKKAK